MRIAPIQINQDPDAARANRERLDADRSKILAREEARVWRYEQNLLQCRNPQAISKAERKLRAAKIRLSKIRLNGSLPSKKRRSRYIR